MIFKSQIIRGIKTSMKKKDKLCKKMIKPKKYATKIDQA